MKMSYRTALKVMEFYNIETPTAEQVRYQFSILAKEGHADHGGNIDMSKLREARDVLAARAPKFEIIDCSQCAGTGSVRGTGFAPVRCKTCNGTGERRDTNG